MAYAVAFSVSRVDALVTPPHLHMAPPAAEPERGPATVKRRLAEEASNERDEPLAVRRKTATRGLPFRRGGGPGKPAHDPRLRRCGAPCSCCATRPRRRRHARRRRRRCSPKSVRDCGRRGGWKRRRLQRAARNASRCWRGCRSWRLRAASILNAATRFWRSTRKRLNVHISLCQFTFTMTMTQSIFVASHTVHWYYTKFIIFINLRSCTDA
ncbi:hypothetical protein PHLGIDRAFT_162079 [Phlebiopsis gigantea 11061_1 CR5-6]|uniref:Uncharacterized protein n=1 Tax=Phlebiopsis gigantea (strain 11061_1 CR5-6) TaxID=745531 RepID=A0A0C3NJZ2_PHLG1|nr:hypothetical protein PHLGIDRAFT_162079 [Phlebiopsis gigantea 11061_1 CR5-6]